jgi:peptidyl-prolyl cis-trans isomerase B (cyclophilin B)
MKQFILTLTACIFGVGLLRADEVALIQLQVGREAKPRLVALEFLEKEAPGHVESFKKLARSGFYKGIAIHRSFPHLMLQMGDPLARKKDRSSVGTGGPEFTLAPEIRGKHVKGSISAARLPDKINPSRRSNGSQFFICLERMPAYDGQYSVFGRILYGMESLDEISTLPVDSNDYPVERIEIRSIRILERDKLPAVPTAAEIESGKVSKPWWRFF